MSIAGDVQRLLSDVGTGPVFVHADAFRAARLVEPLRNRTQYLDSHVVLLRGAAAERDLWLPAFNYDFPRSCLFDVARSASQLGPIPEHFRLETAAWRTPIPIFSVAGLGSVPQVEWREGTDPFGGGSSFARLVAEDGVILYYGDTFHYSTILHYAEREAGGPAYRYDKLFSGAVVMPDGTMVSGSLNYHVRPLGTGLDYAWTAMLEDALKAGVCRRLDTHQEVLAASARRLCELWVFELRQDPLALLDAKSRSWVEPALNEVGRRFTISDFESREPLWIAPS